MSPQLSQALFLRVALPGVPPSWTPQVGLPQVRLPPLCLDPWARHPRLNTLSKALHDSLQTGGDIHEKIPKTPTRITSSLGCARLRSNPRPPKLSPIPTSVNFHYQAHLEQGGLCKKAVTHLLHPSFEKKKSVDLIPERHHLFSGLTKNVAPTFLQCFVWTRKKWQSTLKGALDWRNLFWPSNKVSSYEKLP